LKTAEKNGENATVTEHGFEFRWGHHSFGETARVIDKRQEGTDRGVPTVLL
jgi:hypothetical protein